VTERLEEHYVSRVRHSWVIRSHAATDRVVLVGVPDLMNGRVASPDGAERLTTADGAEREFVPVLLPAGGEVGTEVVTEEGLMEVWHPDGISSAVLHDIAGASGLDDGTRARLQEAEAAFEEDERQRPLAWGKQQEISATSSEILRYRGDLQALAGAGADEDVATDIGWRLVEAGRRLDRLVDEAVRATQAAAAARQRGLTILRTLATGQAQLSTSAAGGGGRSRRLRSPRPRSRTSSAPRRSRRSSTPARRGSDPR
jgi:hypothetical protein